MQAGEANKDANAGSVKGSCLCQAIAFEVDLPVARFVNCHCSRCRKSSGSAYAANALVDGRAFRWTKGEDLVHRYDLPTARRFATCFCSVCGSQLPHTIRGAEAVIIPCGTLDDNPGIAPDMHVHWNSRAAWIEDAGGLAIAPQGPPATSAPVISSSGGVRSDASR